MSLSALARDLGYSPRPVTSPLKTGLFFVLNRAFLPGLKVLIYSMIVQETLLDLPVVVISEEKELLDDLFIQAIADRTIHATDAHIAEFRNISGERVHKALQLDWIAKYTYLKWLIFDDHGFDQEIFIDSDIICLNPCEELLGFTHADLVASPVFETELTRTETGDPLPLRQISSNMRPLTQPRSLEGYKLNSGVMVINKRLLNSQTRYDLIRSAERRKSTVEQSALRLWIRNTDGKRTIGLISHKYNFNCGSFLRMPLLDQAKMLGEITFLHFSGLKRKPWETLANDSIANQLFWGLAREAAAQNPLFDIGIAPVDED